MTRKYMIIVERVTPAMCKQNCPDLYLNWHNWNASQD